MKASNIIFLAAVTLAATALVACGASQKSKNEPVNTGNTNLQTKGSAPGGAACDALQDHPSAATYKKILDAIGKAGDSQGALLKNFRVGKLPAVTLNKTQYANIAVTYTSTEGAVTQNEFGSALVDVKTCDPVSNAATTLGDTVPKEGDCDITKLLTDAMTEFNKTAKFPVTDLKIGVSASFTIGDAQFDTLSGASNTDVIQVFKTYTTKGNPAGEFRAGYTLIDKKTCKIKPSVDTLVAPNDFTADNTKSAAPAGTTNTPPTTNTNPPTDTTTPSAPADPTLGSDASAGE